MIDTAILQLLMADDDLATLVDERIYLGVKDDKAPGDYVVVTVVSNPRPVNVDLSPKQRQAKIQIDGYSVRAVSAEAIGLAVISLFQGRGHIADGHEIQIALLEDEYPGVETDAGLRRYTTEFIFYYH